MKPNNFPIRASLDGTEELYTQTNDVSEKFTLDDVKTFSSQTLQEVLDKHDLVDGNNFQGTGAGSGNTGTDVIGIGSSAAFQNTGDNVNAIGYQSAKGNTGANVIAIGNQSAIQNTGDNVNSIGNGTAFLNSGDDVNAIGISAAVQNTGNNVIAIGEQAARQNTGNNVIALGTDAGIANPLSGMFIISNSELPSYVDWAAANTAISVTGIANNTYLYYDQTTKSIGAVRL
jgi:hypothetical protein